MKRIAILFVVCILCLCGCDINSDNTVQTAGADVSYPADTPTSVPQTPAPVPQTPPAVEESPVGIWSHTEYPNAYTVNIKSLAGRKMSLVLEAVRGNYAQIATAEVDDAYFKNNRTRFSFVDSFGNSGICEITIANNEMQVSYDMGSYQGNWCVDAGAGTYKKADSFRDAPAQNENTETGNPVSASLYFNPGKYVKVIGYTFADNEDIYDKDIYYAFSKTADNEFEYSDYGDTPDGKYGFGTYAVWSSDKPEYHFRLVFDYSRGSREIFYVKTVIPGKVFDFCLADGTPHARYEAYDDYAVKRHSDDGKTYHFRYDYECKQYEKDYLLSALESPFSAID